MPWRGWWLRCCKLTGGRRRSRRQGLDGGVDILAGRGSLGLDAPSLCVQVTSPAPRRGGLTTSSTQYGLLSADPVRSGHRENLQAITIPRLRCSAQLQTEHFPLGSGGVAGSGVLQEAHINRWKTLGITGFCGKPPTEALRRHRSDVSAAPCKRFVTRSRNDPHRATSRRAGPIR